MKSTNENGVTSFADHINKRALRDLGKGSIDHQIRNSVMWPEIIVARVVHGKEATYCPIEAEGSSILGVKLPNHLVAVNVIVGGKIAVVVPNPLLYSILPAFAVNEVVRAVLSNAEEGEVKH